MALAFLDDGNSGFMERTDPMLGGFAGENLLCLADDSLSDGNQTVELTSLFLETSTVKTAPYSAGLRYHMTGHLLELLDRSFPAFRVFPVELFDPEKLFLADLAVGAKGFTEGYLLANPLDLPYDLLSNPMQEIGVGRIGDVLGLRGGVYGHPFGLHQTHIRPGLEQQSFYPFHPIGPDPIPKLHQGRGFQNLATLNGIEPSEKLAISILMKHLNNSFVRTIIPVLQNMDANHEANRLSPAAPGSVVGAENIG